MLDPISHMSEVHSCGCDGRGYNKNSGSVFPRQQTSRSKQTLDHGIELKDRIQIYVWGVEHVTNDMWISSKEGILAGEERHVFIVREGKASEGAEARKHETESHEVRKIP